MRKATTNGSDIDCVSEMGKQGLITYRAFGDLVPFEFLHLVRRVLSNVKTGDPKAANWCLQNLRARNNTSPFGFSLSLLCPKLESGGQDSFTVGKRVIDGVKEVWADFPPRPVQELEHDTTSTPLVQGLYAALLEEHQASAQAEPEPDVWLLFGRGTLDPERVAHQYARCVSVSTACSIGAIQAAAERSFRPLILVKDDPTRHGNLRLVRHSFAKDFHFLSCYVLRDGRKCYLPERDGNGQCAIRLETLEEFVRIFDLVPSIANAISNSAHPDGHLFAMAVGSNDDLQVLPVSLRFVDFRRNFHLNPNIQRDLAIQFLPFSNSSEAHARMQNVFQKDPKYRSYQLQLNRAGVRDFTEKIELLKAQQQKIQTQLDFLMASAEERRRLYRFGHNQLGAMADLLRAIPQQVLQSRQILYGFFATEKMHPEDPFKDGFPEQGYHFLYFEDGSWDIDGANPLRHWLHNHEDILEFWTDPWWEGTYSKDPDETCLVFVPRFEALFPIMHAWTAEEMDEYLRECLNEILPKDNPVPRLPMYLFDHGEGDGIRITVLDRERFVPFYKRMGWVNDQLDIIDELHEMLQEPDAVERCSLAQANSIRWEKIANLLESRCEESRRELKSHSDAMMVAVKGMLRDDLGLLDAILSEYRQESRRLLQEASNLAYKNRELGAHIKRLSQAAAEIDDVAGKVETARQAAEGRFGQNEAQVLQRLKRSAQARAKLEETVLNEIEALRSLRQRLIERIQKVLMGR